MTAEPKRRRRINGEESRSRILDAATEIAGERGYEGTSIALVSKQCGLPASSIYWHFADKDDLIAAVIERSFGRWLAAWELPAESTPEAQLLGVADQIAQALLRSPDFLRLGLMLALERRPVEPRARARYLQVREQALDQIREIARQMMPELTATNAYLLAEYAVAGADGLFIAKEIGGDTVDLGKLFEMHARAVIALATEMAPLSSARP